ncbi:MAG: protein kinase [Planctomycetia bacterium]|nr:protein kinase [Planctomycetia bacterium]
MNQPEKLGPFRIVRVIGRGGMGAVYEAVHEETKETVALKVLTAQEEDNELRVRFESEIGTLKRLRHPNIVRLYGFGQEEGLLYYAMEYVDGPSLQQFLKNGRFFSWEEVVHIGIEVCKALKHAHDRGIVHRDIKPANILLLRNGQVKVSDYGIAHFFGDSRLTTANMVIGTIEYMAPEQAQAGPLTPKSDIYSLGALLYALISGRPPYTAKTLPEIHRMYQSGPPESLRYTRPEVPSVLDLFIMELLRTQPEKRPHNAQIVGRRLEAIRLAFSSEPDKNPFEQWNLASVNSVSNAKRTVSSSDNVPKKSSLPDQYKTVGESTAHLVKKDEGNENDDDIILTGVNMRKGLTSLSNEQKTADALPVNEEFAPSLESTLSPEDPFRTVFRTDKKNTQEFEENADRSQGDSGVPTMEIANPESAKAKTSDFDMSFDLKEEEQQNSDSDSEKTSAAEKISDTDVASSPRDSDAEVLSADDENLLPENSSIFGASPETLAVPVKAAPDSQKEWATPLGGLEDKKADSLIAQNPNVLDEEENSKVELDPPSSRVERPGSLYKEQKPITLPKKKTEDRLNVINKALGPASPIISTVRKGEETSANSSTFTKKEEGTQRSHFTVVREEELDSYRAKAKPEYPLVSPVVWTGIIILILLGLFIWYSLQKPSADQLYQRIESKIDDSDSKEYIAAIRGSEKNIQRFLSLYPNDHRSVKIAQYLNEIELAGMERRLEKQIEQSARNNTLSPVEIAYVEAIRTANINPEIGIQKLEAFIELFSTEENEKNAKKKTEKLPENAVKKKNRASDSEEDPLDLSRKEKKQRKDLYDRSIPGRCVQLAERRLNLVRSIYEQQKKEQTDLLESRLDYADSIEGKEPEKAKEIRNAIVIFYSDRKWAAPLIERSKNASQKAAPKK